VNATRNKYETSGHSDLAATECVVLEGVGDSRAAFQCMAAMVAAMWDQLLAWRIYSPEIAKPAGEAGRAYRQGPGEIVPGKLVFSHLSVFCK